MKYISQINAFYDHIEINPLSSGQMILWHGLMHINNKCAWIEWFSVASRVLEIKTGLSRQSIVKARNVLKQKGYIDFKVNGKKATLYSIRKLYTSQSLHDGLQGGIEGGLHDGIEGGLQGGSPSGLPLNRLDKTRQDKSNRGIVKTSEEALDDSSPAEEIKTAKSTSINYQAIIDHWAKVCAHLPQPKKLTDTRRRKIRSRISEYDFDTVIDVIDKTAESDFLSGRKKDGRSWHATFDWIIEPANFTKTLEGNYANKDKSAPVVDDHSGFDWGISEEMFD